jgi:hypothetical protein
MPRISDAFTDCAAYIYGSLQDAKLGEHQGGSGFLVHAPFEQNPEVGHIYVVTNRHVILKAGDPVVRLNRRDGTVECLETSVSQWKQHPYGDDVAVFPLYLDCSHLRFWSIPTRYFITKTLIHSEDIGIGDDTFMVGRFINHEGKQQNAPSLRFGNIAMMAKETITSPNGIDQESFLIEIRSLPGYSGSAVFLHSPSAMNDMSVRRAGKDRPGTLSDNLTKAQENFLMMEPFLNPKGPYLLGIDWCHIPRKAPIRSRDGLPIEEGWYVEENTGMAGVIPAWKIRDILDDEELKMQRKSADDHLTEKKKSSPISLDSADKQPDIFTQEDFETALKKASRKLSGQT